MLISAWCKVFVELEVVDSGTVKCSASHAADMGRASSKLASVLSCVQALGANFVFDLRRMELPHHRPSETAGTKPNLSAEARRSELDRGSPVLSRMIVITILSARTSVR